MKDDGKYFTAFRLKRVVVDTQLGFDLAREIIGVAVGKVVEVLEDTALHFLRSPVGKGHGENKTEVFRLPAQRQHDVSFRQRAGFAGAGGRSVDVKSLCHLSYETGVKIVILG